MAGLSAGTDALAYYFFGLKIFLFFVATFIFVSSLDDFFTDICFFIRSIYRRWFVMPRYRPMTAEDLDRPEQRVAILIPAWQESAVIGRMLDHLLATMNYRNYTAFVGVYSNDAETEAAVRRVASGSSHIQIVLVPRPGPTSKGDCLNALLEGMQARETQTGEYHSIIALHDAEDIVHPLELKLFNKLIPRKDMVQLPVIPLEAPLRGLTAGHYMDEFAEQHTKDLAIREALTGSIPSAGVGCAFSREAFARLAEVNNGTVFDTATLAEDYQIAMLLQEMGKKLIFVRFFVDRPQSRDEKPGKRVRELVGTREYFPAGFRAAYKQKARWLVGIAFQGWREFGWRGSLAAKYAYFRDRKSVVSAQVNILAYVVVSSIIITLAIYWLIPGSYRYPPLVHQGSWLYYILLGNLFFLLNRLVQRAVYTYRIYGPGHAAVSPVRLIWGNFINFFASTRAIRLFTRALATGRPLGWEKTFHRFPSAEELAPYHRRLGHLLVARGLTNDAAVARALAQQQQTGDPLGEILVADGAITERDMLSVVASQNNIPFESGIPADVESFSRILERDLQQSLAVVPIAATEDGVTVASFRLLSEEARKQLESAAGRPVRQVLCPRSAVEHRLAALREAEP